MPLSPEQLLSSPHRLAERTTLTRELTSMPEILALVREVEPDAAVEFDFAADAFERHMRAVLQEARTYADAIQIVREQLGVARNSRAKARESGRPGLAVGWDTKGRAELAQELKPGEAPGAKARAHMEAARALLGVRRQEIER